MSSGDGSEFPRVIDLQANGIAGIDFSAEGLTAEQCHRAFDTFRAARTAMLLPTLITAPSERLTHNLRTIAQSVRSYAEPDAVPGIHLEGPFLEPTPGAIGAHNPEWVRAPDPELLDDLIEAAEGTIRIITVAAGVPGIERLIAHAVRRGLVVSLGHHTAGYAAVRRAADAGATLLTHLGNGLPHEINRHENPIFAGLHEARLSATLIGDGHHLPDELLALIVRTKGIEHSILVSDAAPVAGLPPGRHMNLGSKVEVTTDGLVINPETGYLAGSGRTLAECVDRLLAEGVFSYEELVVLAVENPRRVLRDHLQSRRSFR